MAAPTPADAAPLSASEVRERELRVRARTEAAIEHLASVDLAAAASVLRVGRIVVTSDPQIRTAALVKAGSGTMDRFKICMDAEFCDRPQEEITAILLHELLHHIMRHLHSGRTRISENAQMANVVGDAFINWTIHLTSPSLAKFFADFYPADKSPQLFLRTAGKPGAKGQDAGMHKALYSGALTEQDLVDYLKSSQGMSDEQEYILIGSHGAGGQGDDGSGQPAIPASQVGKVVKEIAGQMSGSKEGGQLAGKLSGLLTEFREAMKVGRSSGIEDVFRMSLVDACRHQIIEAVAGDVRDRPRRQVIMPMDVGRPDMYRVLAGVPTFFWRTPDFNGAEGKVRCYVDVSGSMGREVEFIYGCLASLEEYLDSEIYLFSNEISSITLAELKAGKVDSTGGTDFDCIIEHFLDGDAGKAVLFTDGYAGLKGDLAGALASSGRKVFGVVTSHGDEGVMGGFCEQVFRLPEIPGGF